MKPAKPKQEAPPKPPVIRKGQHKPYTKANYKAQAERVAFCRDLVTRRVGKSAARLQYMAKYGGVWQTSDRYMRHAVDEIAAESGKNPKQAKAEAVTFYESVVANPDSSDHAYAGETSANLRSCNNLEQFSLTNSRPLFNFHKSWIGRMLPA
jgi:hypothetical protein